MYITRDGKTYKLEDWELSDAYREQKHKYMIEDVKSKAEEMEIDLTDKNVDDIAYEAEHCLDNNDSFWESYWMSIEYALEE
jgi:hypothetical protein